MNDNKLVTVGDILCMIMEKWVKEHDFSAYKLTVEKVQKEPEEKENHQHVYFLDNSR